MLKKLVALSLLVSSYGYSIENLTYAPQEGEDGHAISGAVLINNEPTPGSILPWHQEGQDIAGEGENKDIQVKDVKDVLVGEPMQRILHPDWPIENRDQEYAPEENWYHGRETWDELRHTDRNRRVNASAFMLEDIAVSLEYDADRLDNLDRLSQKQAEEEISNIASDLKRYATHLHEATLESRLPFGPVPYHGPVPGQIRYAYVTDEFGCVHKQRHYGKSTFIVDTVVKCPTPELCKKFECGKQRALAYEAYMKEFEPKKYAQEMKKRSEVEKKHSPALPTTDLPLIHTAQHLTER